MIRLLKLDDDGSICLDTFEYDDSVPKYAILSHTWSLNNAEELSFKDLVERKDRRDSTGYKKVYSCLQQAASNDITYCWVDTCCIDKSSSEELREAITSMFRWYKEAAKCYAYLSDVSINDSTLGHRLARSRWEAVFKQSRWFTRGWTLQELLAPSALEFYSSEWKLLGNKTSLERAIHEVTNIPITALRLERPLTDFGVEERMSWANSRTTKRPEDKAYCLLGILDVIVIPCYGEGEINALSRLRKAIEESPVHQVSDRRKVSRPRGHEPNQDLPSKRPKNTTEPSPESILLESLRFQEIEARSVNISAPHFKTCRWLLKDPQYVAWLDPERKDEHDGFLWIKGKAGSGKSTIMKFAFESVRKTKKGGILLSFFFNARGSDLEKSVAGAYRTLLVQLLEQDKSLKSIFRETLGTQMSEATRDPRWNIKMLEALLTEAIYGLGETPVTCFIDALDECDEGEVRQMISFLDNLCQESVSCPTGSRVRICFASRHYPFITIPRGLEMNLDEKPGHAQDIINYLATKLKIGSDSSAEEIRRKVAKKASGIFIWLVLVVEILNETSDGGNRRLLWKKLSEIPDNIYELFEKILTRDNKNKDGTKLCIQWILFAKNPLTARQLFHAVLSGTEEPSSLHPESSTIDVEEYDICKFVLANSKGLAEVTESTEIPTVQFVHESVKDFLLKEKGFQKIWPECTDCAEGYSHDRLKECCLTYIRASSDALSKKNRAYLCEWIDIKVPFLRYAVETVIYHADQASKHGIQQNQFLQDFDISLWVKFLNVLEKYSFRLPKKGVSMLYLLAEMDAPGLIEEHPDVLSYLQLENQHCGTPLFAALSKGNKAAVLAFLKAHIRGEQLGVRFDQLLTQYSESPGWQGDFEKFHQFPTNGTVSAQLIEAADNKLLDFVVDANSWFGDDSFLTNQSTFMAAAKLGRLEIVSRLIDEGVDVNEGLSKPGVSTAIHLAAMNGHEHVIEVLCDNNVIVNQETINQTAERRHWDVFRMLLRYKVSKDHQEMSSRNRYLFSMLHAASEKGENEVIKILIAEGTDVNAQGDFGSTALQVAASHNRSADTVRLLLDKGADVNAQGGKYGNALQAAVAPTYIRSISSEIVWLLLNAGADINAQGGEYGNALQAASSSRSVKMVELLLDRGADVNAQGGKYGNALQAASSSRSVKMVELLLDRGADVNAQGGIYGNALQAASSSGSVEMVELLLDKGADVNAQGGEYGNALQAASSSGSVEMVELLLDKGADVNAQGGEHGNALQAASSSGSVEMVELLLDKGADVNAQGGIYGNALQAALLSRSVEMVELLLDRGADVNAQGGEHGNALQAASSSGSVEMVELLLDKGADVNAQGGIYGNALQAALFSRSVEMVELLLDRGADVNAQGGIYGNALQAALFSQSVEIVELLLDGGADVNAQGGIYGNALQAASSSGSVEIVELLLDRGADVNAQGGIYGNALKAAKKSGFSETVRLLRRRGAIESG